MTCRQIRRFAMLSLLLFAASLIVGHAFALDPATGAADQFFGLDKVYTFHLTFTAAEYHKLEPANGGSMARPGVSGDDRYPTSTAVLEFEGKKWGTLNLRYKGNSSYRSAGALKRPIKLEFEGPDGAKDKSRTFFGMSKINLNNNAMDASQMRESLGYDVFRQEGVPCARTAFAKLYLTVPGIYNNQYAGIYTVVEQIDQTFFKDRFGKKTGPVVKPEELVGMPYLGENWDSYVVPYGAKSADKIDPEDAKRFIAYVRFVKQASDEEFAKRIREFVDVDEFLHFLAVEVMTVNLDSPLAMNHNYYITINPKTQKVVWVPWDLNLAFGGFVGGGRGGPGSAQQDLSINKPSLNGQFPLADRILAVPEFLKQYDAIVRALVTKNFTVKRLGGQMDLMAGAIRAAVKADAGVAFAQFEKNMDPNGDAPASPAPVPGTQPANGGFVVVDPGGGFGPGPGFGGFGGGFGRGRGGMGGPPLRQFLALRVESVLEQLDGKRDGFTSTGRAGRGGFGPRGFGN